MIETSFPHGVHGRLDLRFERQARTGRTTLAVRDQQPPLQVVRAFRLHDGAALVHLHNIAGGVVGGDCLELNVAVGADAHAQLTSTGATRIYRSRTEDDLARQITTVDVAAGGVLEYVPDQIIPYAGSRYQQRTRIDLAEGAGLFWWETVAPGREARGELFAYNLLDLRLDLCANGRLIAIEHARIKPHRRSLASPTLLGAYRYWTSFVICRVGLGEARWLELEAQLADLALHRTCIGSIEWGVSTLAAEGVVVRALSRTSDAIASDLHAFWHAAKLALYQQAAIPPRKVP